MTILNQNKNKNSKTKSFVFKVYFSIFILSFLLMLLYKCETLAVLNVLAKCHPFFGLPAASSVSSPRTGLVPGGSRLLGRITIIYTENNSSLFSLFLLFPPHSSLWHLHLHHISTSSLRPLLFTFKKGPNGHNKVHFSL